MNWTLTAPNTSSHLLFPPGCTFLLERERTTEILVGDLPSPSQPLEPHPGPRIKARQASGPQGKERLRNHQGGALPQAPWCRLASGSSEGQLYCKALSAGSGLSSATSRCSHPIAEDTARPLRFSAWNSGLPARTGPSKRGLYSGGCLPDSAGPPHPAHTSVGDISHTGATRWYTVGKRAPTGTHAGGAQTHVSCVGLPGQC